jgi:hypothetical protein
MCVDVRGLLITEHWWACISFLVTNDPRLCTAAEQVITKGNKLLGIITNSQGKRGNQS